MSQSQSQSQPHLEMSSLQLVVCFLPCVLPSPPPNIVVILADDLGLHDVPWHNTDTLVRNSIL